MLVGTRILLTTPVRQDVWYHHQTIIPSQMPPELALEGEKRIDDTEVDKRPVGPEVLIHDGIT